jgi:hypothetical protein
MSERNKRVTKLSWETTRYINTNSRSGLSQIIQLHNAWEKIASPIALDNTDNITFSTKSKNPEVLIYVENSHWAAELEAQKELYRILLEKETGQPIYSIKFLVTRKTAYKKAFLKWREKSTTQKKSEKSIPLTKEEDRYTRQMLAKIQNENLRNKLYNAMKADFEWKKGTEGLKLPENTPESPETI